MNFLEICQEIRSKAGISGTGPTTVISQTGEMGRVVSWGSEAWTKIQLLHDDWMFLWSDFSFTTDSSYCKYSPANTSIRDFDLQSLKIYETTEGVTDESRLRYREYRDFHYKLEPYTTSTASRPTTYTITPEREIQLYPWPDSTGYTVVGQCWTSPEILSSNADTPNIPAEYHMAIVWRAVMLYADYEEASDLRVVAEINFKEYLNQLEKRYLPELTIVRRPIA